MTSLTPFRCDRCNRLCYEPEEIKQTWKFPIDEEQDLCCLCNSVMQDYFFFGHLTKFTLSCEGTMKNENNFVKEQKEVLKDD